jgi:hypothetical protein
VAHLLETGYAFVDWFLDMAITPASPQSIHSRLDVREFTPGTSLLSVSRLSLANSRHDLYSVNTHENATPIASVDHLSLSSASEDGNNFHCSLQIDMKDLMGDAVGNVSIITTKTIFCMLAHVRTTTSFGCDLRLFFACAAYLTRQLSHLLHLTSACLDVHQSHKPRYCTCCVGEADLLKSSLMEVLFTDGEAFLLLTLRPR